MPNIRNTVSVTFVSPSDPDRFAQEVDRWLDQLGLHESWKKNVVDCILNVYEFTAMTDEEVSFKSKNLCFSWKYEEDVSSNSNLLVVTLSLVNVQSVKT